MKAVWNGIVLAESNDTVVVEGNHYFPPRLNHGRIFPEQFKQDDLPLEGIGQLLQCRRQRRCEP